MIGNCLRKIIQQLLLILCILKKRNMSSLYLKTNLNCEKQITLLMIPNNERERWHYIAVKKLSALLHGIAL